VGSLVKTVWLCLGLAVGPQLAVGWSCLSFLACVNGLRNQVSYLVGPQFQAFNYVSPVFQLWLVDITCETSLGVCQLVGVVRVMYGMP